MRNIKSKIGEVKNMKDKDFFLKQFEQLEARISTIAKTSRTGFDKYTHYVDTAMYLQWRTQVITLLRQVYPQQLFPVWLEAKENIASSRRTNFSVTVGIFRAAYEDFKNGMLDDLQMEIESGVAVDYLQQAESLMEDGGEIDCGYIPAAVLTGSVLEKTLRTLCQKRNPPIDINNDNGKPKKAQRLLEDLRKVSLFTPVEAKQIEAWLTLRNSAAHGRDSEFNKSDVASMIRGVTDFLAKYMR